jgi:hypothetical protein
MVMAGLYDFNVALKLQNVPFDALIMAAVMKADGENRVKLIEGFSDLYHETQARYNAPGGKLEGDR